MKWTKHILNENYFIRYTKGTKMSLVYLRPSIKWVCHWRKIDISIIAWCLRWTNAQHNTIHTSQDATNNLRKNIVFMYALVCAICMYVNTIIGLKWKKKKKKIVTKHNVKQICYHRFEGKTRLAAKYMCIHTYTIWNMVFEFS